MRKTITEQAAATPEWVKDGSVVPADCLCGETLSPESVAFRHPIHGVFAVCMGCGTNVYTTLAN